MARHIKTDNTPINTLIKNIKNIENIDIEIFQKSLSELKKRFEFLDIKDQRKIIQVLPEFGKTNTSIATLIKNFSNKRSRKVRESRAELLKRYNYLEKSDQKKVIRAFLLSGSRDRQWAYDELLVNWDDSFESLVEEIWVQYHEIICSWVIINHFPIDYIIKNIDSFKGKRDYFFICKRLAIDENVIVDRTRLSNIDYLALLYHTGRTLDLIEARDLLYTIVHDICLEPIRSIYLDKYAFRHNILNEPSKGEIVCPNQFQVVSMALYYLKKLNLDEIVDEFNIWNQTVKRMILDSFELKNINQKILQLTDFQYETQIMLIARKYTYIALADNYKVLDRPIKKQKINDEIQTQPIVPPEDFMFFENNNEDECPF